MSHSLMVLSLWPVASNRGFMNAEQMTALSFSVNVCVRFRSNKYDSLMHLSKLPLIIVSGVMHWRHLTLSLCAFNVSSALLVFKFQNLIVLSELPLAKYFTIFFLE